MADAEKETKKTIGADVKNMFDKLNAQIKDLSDSVKNKYIPETENKIKDNLFVSLAVSFGAGLICGLCLMIIGLISGKKK